MFSFRACATALRSGLFTRLSNNAPAGLTSGVTISQPVTTVVSRPFSGLSLQVSGMLNGYNSLLVNPFRSIMKINFPRARENKRMGKFSWKIRMSTPGGRRIIMRRILKGRHILTH